jgi:hypothetical protein
MGLLTSLNLNLVLMTKLCLTVMTKTEGTPTPQSTRWGHQNTIYLSRSSDTAGGAANGTIDFDGTTYGNAEGSSD